jgi:hypothetical protein
MGSDVDALFKLPLGEFTSARNALVTRLKKAGQQVEADEAKALSKPSVSAWVVNQLHWFHRDLFDRLLEAGEQLRNAQATQQTSNTAREPVNARREAVTELARKAAEILRDGGYSATRDMMRRVTSTLEALSTYGSLPGAPSAGRLTDDVEPPGFELFAELMPRSVATGEIPPRVRSPKVRDAAKTARRAAPHDAAAPGRDEQRLAAKGAVREAERALSVARKQVEREAANLKTVTTRAEKSDKRRAEIEKELARAAKEADAAHEQVRAAETVARAATEKAERAERALGLARGRLKQLKGNRD